MFKENYIKELAFKNIKNQKKIYKYVAISLFMSFFLSSFMFIMFSSYNEISYQERVSHFGKWSVAIDNNVRNIIASDYANEQQGKIYFLSSIFDKGKELGKLGALDNEAIKQVNLQLISGHFPKNNKEIVIEEDQCEYLGIKGEFGKTIELIVEENGSKLVRNYKLVGITKNYSSTYPIEIPSYLTLGSSEEYTLVLNSSNNLKLINAFVNNGHEQYVTLNNYTYNNYTWDIDKYSNPSILRYMEILIVTIGIVGVVSTMLSVMNKRTEYFVLIRSLGATLFQIQKAILYECLYLMIPTIFGGVVMGIIMSGVILNIYHYMAQYPFLIVINLSFLFNICLTVLFTFLSLFLVSLSVYRTPLNTRVRQKIEKPKKRTVKKLNILSLSLLEISNNKKIFILLGFIVSISIMFTTFFVNQIFLLVDNEQEEVGFSHQVSGESLTIQDVTHFNKIGDVKPLFFQYQNIKSHVEGLERWKGSSQYYDKTGNLPFDYWLSNCNMATFGNNEDMSLLFARQNFKGSIPKNKFETVVIVPYIDISKSLAQSFTPMKKGELEDNQIKIGDYIDIADVAGENKYMEQLKVVGTIHYKVDDKKISELTSYGGYQFLVGLDTYSNYFQKSGYKSIYFDTNEPLLISRIKSNIYTLMQTKPDIFFTDNVSLNILLEAQRKNDFYKDISFAGLFIVGTLSLIYIQRKLRFIALKQDIDLMKAVGLTNDQLISIYIIYDFLIYAFAISILFLLILFINRDSIVDLVDILFNKLLMVSIGISGILISTIMILPILGKKQSID